MEKKLCKKKIIGRQCWQEITHTMELLSLPCAPPVSTATPPVLRGDLNASGWSSSLYPKPLKRPAFVLAGAAIPVKPLYSRLK
jgi:hypothetical protein